MDFRPVSKASIPFSLKKGVFSVHLGEWNYTEFRGLDDAQRLTLAAQNDAVFT
jgi:hypothetical protein